MNIPQRSPSKQPPIRDDSRASCSTTVARLPHLGVSCPACSELNSPELIAVSGRSDWMSLPAGSDTRAVRTVLPSPLRGLIRSRCPRSGSKPRSCQRVASRAPREGADRLPANTRQLCRPDEVVVSSLLKIDVLDRSPRRAVPPLDSRSLLQSAYRLRSTQTWDPVMQPGSINA